MTSLMVAFLSTRISTVIYLIKFRWHYHLLGLYTYIQGKQWIATFWWQVRSTKNPIHRNKQSHSYYHDYNKLIEIKNLT